MYPEIVMGWMLATLLGIASSPAKAESLFPGTGLSDLPRLNAAETRMISPENPTGEKGGGARDTPDTHKPNPNFWEKAPLKLGQGWKVSPFVELEPHESRTIMEVSGPGVIEHIWMTASNASQRSNVLRMYWGNAKTPAVESPLPDFFAVGHGKVAPVNSLPVVVTPKSGFNAYWPMPFRKHARITITNESTERVELMTYQITYALRAVPRDVGYFHAQWNQAPTGPADGIYTIFEKTPRARQVRGNGPLLEDAVDRAVVRRGRSQILYRR